MVAEVEKLGRWARVDLAVGVGTRPPRRPAEEHGLTEREREVLASLVAGRTNREIADAMFISVKTASVHVSNILRKLGRRQPRGGRPPGVAAHGTGPGTGNNAAPPCVGSAEQNLS